MARKETYNKLYIKSFFTFHTVNFDCPEDGYAGAMRCDIVTLANIFQFSMRSRLPSPETSANSLDAIEATAKWRKRDECSVSHLLLSF